MPRTNKDIEDLHKEGRFFGHVEETVTELFEECKGESNSGKSIAYGDKGAPFKEWWWLSKKMMSSGEIKVKALSNGFEVTVPKWMAERNGWT